ncbi:hypothetical protein B0T11DRAFT_144676 [Plectosphaerella cucumerina]|uniref:Uncharacterized protein n=1 Tax=Plectosphaerella cucumerina TaxID=40658 RepID=A0A8K0T577_9PEZI|nr:hypothetical protein B0T11DRAFT_144676 [Plectosphaerella cucumerina]
MSWCSAVVLLHPEMLKPLIKRKTPRPEKRQDARLARRCVFYRLTSVSFAGRWWGPGRRLSARLDRIEVVWSVPSCRPRPGLSGPFFRSFISLNASPRLIIISIRPLPSFFGRAVCVCVGRFVTLICQPFLSFIAIPLFGDSTRFCLLTADNGRRGRWMDGWDGIGEMISLKMTLRTAISSPPMAQPTPWPGLRTGSKGP